ncbi:acyl-CoA dehydrogenase family protein [Nocardia coubleae]|uniref:Acyl-CoA dehydrogenase/oxidase C-terminal domain-containing protein n=1 Tax=Nocardia coubleae TaxID=356147 RepID=A0A846W212_9NOCA|nr:acyl-CoA dehydrogenase family protein [Nocardia coubleae]NKX86850.1 hypothetical protein [Nocardia coubleae]
MPGVDAGHTGSLAIRPDWKFMPNIADPTTPKIGVVTARLIIGGSDEGVLPLLLRLRTDQGLTPGLRVAALPDKGWAPMNHALIRFDKVFVPAEGLLGGTWAVMGAHGMASTVPVRARFHRAITTLGQGRLDLAGTSAAGARAGLAVTINYARQRRPGGRTLMAERGTVSRDLVSALAATYATSVLGWIRGIRASPRRVCCWPRWQWRRSVGSG